MNWVTRVNAGLKKRAEGEAEIAKALRERLDKVGEATWLKECEAEWGWSRTTAYRHLNPELLQKERDRAAARYENRNLTRRSSNGRTPSDQDGNGGSTPALPLHYTANRSPEPRKDGQPDRRFAVNGSSMHGALRAFPDSEQMRRTLNNALEYGLKWLADVEASAEFLTPKKVEILCGMRDRLGAVIERHGHDGGNSETEALADDTKLVEVQSWKTTTCQVGLGKSPRTVGRVVQS